MIRCVLFLSAVLCVAAYADRTYSRSEIDGLLAKRASGQELTQREYNRLTDGVSEFTDSQLVSVLHNGKSDLLREMCRTEIATRAALHPHWTVVPAFWLIMVSVIISLAALFLTWRGEIRAQRIEETQATFLPRLNEATNSLAAISRRLPGGSAYEAVKEAERKISESTKSESDQQS